MLLDHHLDRTITIEAPQDLVFKYFTTSERWAAWWGPGSSIEPTPGGRVVIRYPNGVEGGGEVVEVVPPERIVFTFGFASGVPMAIGASRVRIDLAPVARGTRVHLQHHFADAGVRDQHVQGWRYQLSVFANVVADALHADGAALVGRWYSAWAETDAATRRQALAEIASPDVRMRDRYSHVEGIEELTAHIGAAQVFMPGLRMESSGAVRHCQGMLLADWVAKGPDGQPKASGTNVFALDAGGRIESVTGFW
jgi:uncharacterized protein YndB with AHSA1/START domain